MAVPPRLAIVATHPVQYHAPWFAHLADRLRAEMEVFYLWDFGVTTSHDPGFGRTIQWDIDLLKGYAHRFVRNVARNPGTHHFFGLHNPSLLREIADWRPDAILLLGYRYLSHVRLLVSPSLARIPIIFRGDSHLLAESPGPHLAKRLALRLLFRRMTAFLPVGSANSFYFLRYGVPSRRLFHAPHCVDNARFSAPAHEKAGLAWRRELGFAEDDRVILFAGKFEKKKRPDLLLRVFRETRFARACLLLVGSGPLENQLRDLAGHDPRIRFVPFQNQSAMPRVYAAADLVVLPSEGPGETWGLSINEACCAGRAVLVSDHVGCRLDLVRPRENGLIFRAGSASSLRDSLEMALADDARLRAWSMASRRLVDAFTFEAATAGLQQALDFTLAERGA